MTRAICSLFVCCCLVVGVSTTFADTFSCGDGYVLVEHSKVDGVATAACEKLWCMDLENGQMMGDGNTPSAGYRATSEPILLKDNTTSNEIMCFGDRKWCAGEVAGEWNREYGGYTRGGADSATYKSYQKGGCFAWRLEKPSCEAGQVAILENGEWVCAIEEQKGVGTRASSLRRTSNIRLR